MFMAAVLSQSAFADQRPIEFVERAPLPGFAAVGSFSAWTAGDLDGDGDLDVISGENFGGLFYFENTGTAIEPAFSSASISGLADAGYLSRPALGDLDHDGDLDLLVGEQYGTFKYYENTGTTTAPDFASTTSLPGLTSLIGWPSPVFGDVDGDGNLDVLAGDSNGQIHFFRNTGSFSNPAFSSTTLSGLDLSPILGPTRATPALGDIDGDGDLDVYSGETDGQFVYFENTGSVISPAFTTSQISGLTDVGSNSVAALADIDRDGDLDLLAGSFNGDLRVFELVRSPVDFEGPGNTSGTLPGLTNIGSYSTPAIGDIDDDGDLDVLRGMSDGSFVVFWNSGTPLSPSFSTAALAGVSPFGSQSSPTIGDLDTDGDADVLAGAFDGNFAYYAGSAPGDPSFSTSSLAGLSDVGFYSAPTFGDIDADGDLDVISGVGGGGSLRLFENTGGPDAPAFAASTTLVGTGNAGFLSQPALGDVDRDGDLDIMVGEYYGALQYFENTGTATAPAFREVTPDGFPTLFLRAAPSFGDIDSDGDLDVVAGDILGNLIFFEVTTTPKDSPLFTEITLPGLDDVGTYSAPAFGDLDGDGDIDMVSGDFNANFVYYENTGSTTSPAFNTTTLGALAGIGNLTTPVLGDVDGDGDLDLLSGSYDSSFVYFENTGSSTTPAFGSSTTLPGLDLIIGFCTPALGDLDGDGDLDFVGGDQTGNFFHAENTGTPTSPAFSTTTTLPGFFDVGSRAAPSLQDIDGDGDLDLLVGDTDGTFSYLENTGNINTPEFANNRLAKLGDLGQHTQPAFADLDADGDPDLLVGEDSGEFFYFQNTSRFTIPRITQGDRIKIHALKNGSPDNFLLGLNASDDLGHQLTWSIQLAASNGVASVSGTGESKDIFYDPDTDFTGDDVFIVRVTNEHGHVDTATLVVEVVDADADIEDLRDNFDTYDTNNDDELTEAEILAANGSFILDFIDALDTSGDGEIQLEELVAYAGFPPDGSLATAYVDFDFVGEETGEPASPFNTLFEGIFNVQANGTVEIQAGSSDETITINKIVRLESSGGSAVIGLQP